MCVTIEGVCTGDSICWPLYHTTRNYKYYSSIDNLNTLQIIIAHTKSSQSAFISRLLVTDPNNGDSSASVLTSLLSGK
jgi:hypothetical protein